MGQSEGAVSRGHKIDRKGPKFLTSGQIKQRTMNTNLLILAKVPAGRNQDFTVCTSTYVPHLGTPKL